MRDIVGTNAPTQYDPNRNLTPSLQPPSGNEIVTFPEEWSSLTSEKTMLVPLQANRLSTNASALPLDAEPESL